MGKGQMGNAAAVVSSDILFLVSVGHVVENARLVDVDGAVVVVRAQAVSFVVVHGRLFSHQIHHSTRVCFHTSILVVVRSAVGETGGRRGSRHPHPNPSVLMKVTFRRVELGTIVHKHSDTLTIFHLHILQDHLRPRTGCNQTIPTWILHGDICEAETPAIPHIKPTNNVHHFFLLAFFLLFAANR